MFDLHSIALLAAYAEDRWSNEMFGLDANQRFVLLLTIIGCVTAVIISTVSIGFAWANSLHRRRIETEMKREMLDRGMSADDVIKVIESVPPPEDAAGRWLASWCNKKK